MKYAVVENGRNQIVIKEGEAVLIDDLSPEEGSIHKWEKILLFRDGDDLKVGQPYVKGSSASGKVLGRVKGPKVINFKKKRRKGYTRKVGHRQNFTRVLVEEIK